MRKIIGIGEALWDCIGQSRRPAGAPANVAYHAAQWGLESCVFSRVGNDDLGRELIEFLRQYGVDTRFIQVDDSLPTCKVEVDVSQSTAPQFVIPENAAWDNMEYTDLWEQASYEAQAVCFGTLAQRSDVSRETIDYVLSTVPNDCLVLFDVNLRPPFFYRKWIERSLFYSWVVKISEEEAELFANEMGLGVTHSGKEYAQALRDNFGVEAVCFTKGVNGCALYTQEESIEIPGITVPLTPQTDTVGAGDAFSAALIYGFLNELPVPRVLEIANRAAAYTVSQPGSMPPVKEYYSSICKKSQ